jgi:ppGpp synthetase/RelA/SpoT-type nucleotidyltranferase
MPISMIFDDETKWAVITGEYVRIVNEVKALPKGVDEKVETAKIIANSAILRHVTASVQSTNSVL